MDVEKMLAELRSERDMIEQAIIALERMASSGGDRPRRGRPPKNTERPVVEAEPAKRRKRQLSPEGRARIAEAARKRWAEARAGKQG